MPLPPNNENVDLGLEIPLLEMLLQGCVDNRGALLPLLNLWLWSQCQKLGFVGSGFSAAEQHYTEGCP